MIGKHLKEEKETKVSINRSTAAKQVAQPTQNQSRDSGDGDRYAQRLSETDFDGFRSKGVQPKGHSGFALIGNIKSQAGDQRDLAYPVSVEMGDLTVLLKETAEKFSKEERGDSFRFTGEFRGRRVVVRLIDGTQPYLGLGEKDVVDVKVFHNPKTLDQVEHHLIQIGKGRGKTQGVVTLVDNNHPTADLVVLTTIIKDGRLIG